MEFHQTVDFIKHELGLKVCVNFIHQTVNLLADCSSVLELALTTIAMLIADNVNKLGCIKRLKGGQIEWSVYRKEAILLLKLFQNELSVFVENYMASLSIELGDKVVSFEEYINKKTCTADDKTPEDTLATLTSNSDVSNPGKVGNAGEFDGDVRMTERVTLAVNQSVYPQADSDVKDIVEELASVHLLELERPVADAFVVKQFVRSHENSGTVYCDVAENEDARTLKLTIIARDMETVRITKERFVNTLKYKGNVI